MVGCSKARCPVPHRYHRTACCFSSVVFPSVPGKGCRNIGNKSLAIRSRQAINQPFFWIRIFFWEGCNVEVRQGVSQSALLPRFMVGPPETDGGGEPPHLKTMGLGCSKEKSHKLLVIAIVLLPVTQQPERNECDASRFPCRSPLTCTLSTSCPTPIQYPLSTVEDATVPRCPRASDDWGLQYGYRWVGSASRWLSQPPSKKGV